MSEHKAWRKENTLTAPADRDPNKSFRLDQTTPPLNEEQLSAAMKELNNTSFLERFPAVERRYADPPLDFQKIGLISFVPAKGARPNDNGVYGFAKLRGNFATEVEANDRAEFLIRNVDSYQEIYHAVVGRPFPLTKSSDYSKEVNRVDLRKETADAISEDVKKKREKEQKDIEEIQQREKELLEDVNKKEEPTDDRYTTLRVKKAQLTWTYVETMKKMEQVRGLIAKARHEINQIDREHPELKETYYQKYVEARRKAGLPLNTASSDQNFMRFLVEDVTLPEVDEVYNRMFGSEHSVEEKKD